MGLAALERTTMTVRVLILFVLLTGWCRATERGPEVCVVVGAEGEPEFAANFAKAAKAWEASARRGAAQYTAIGLGSESQPSDRARLQTWISERVPEGNEAIWIVYLGHGTFDGREARLNLRGDDVTAKELSGWLNSVRRPVVFIHGGSASAPFISALSAPGRIIVTATRSGSEMNYARFGERFASAVTEASADIDQDGQTSLLEAFVTAAQQVHAFYTENSRLATEHALLDDNGDKQGTPADWFRGTRLQRRPKGKFEPDGAAANRIALAPTEAERALTAEQRTRRDQLEQELEALRAHKAELPEDEYYRRVEAIVRQIGAIYLKGT
jgi:hypothetical protein